MNSKEREKIVDNMLKLRNSITMNGESKDIDVTNIGYYKDFNFKGSGLAVNDVYVVEMKRNSRTLRIRNQREKLMYEIYDKDNVLIATVNEMGEVSYEPEFIKELENISEEHFKLLTLDETEFELPEKLKKDDMVLNKEELNEKSIDRKMNDISCMLKTKDINSYSEMETDQKIFDKITNKQELDANVRVTQTETLSDLIPELKEKGIQKVGVVYSDNIQGQNGRFSFVGIDKDGKMQMIESLENIDGTTTGQKVTSINSIDGSLVEQEQVAGMVRLSDRTNTNEQEEYLSVRLDDYGIPEVDYVRADLSKPKDKRYISAPIETKNIYPTTREVRDFMDRSYNPEIGKEIERAEPEINRDEETSMENIDDTASNDYLTPDDIILLEDGTKTTLRKEADKAKVSPEEFTNRYNEMSGKTPDEKIDKIQEEIVEEYGAPTRRR